MMRKDQEAGTDEHIEPNEGAEVPVASRSSG